MSQRSHKRKAKAAPPLVVGSGGTSSAISFRSHDNRRQRNVHGVVPESAGSSARDAERNWEEDLATLYARSAELFTYRLGDDSLSSQPDDMDIPDDGIHVVVPTRNINSYVHEHLRREGRGAPKVYSRCKTRDCAGVAEFRCVDGMCVGEAMYCARCIVQTHAQLPTHFVEKWTGTHFKRRRTWLRDLGLRIQLGHPPGSMCPFKQAAPHDFVLYDLTGVHEIGVDFCGCLTEPTEGTDDLRPVAHRTQLLRVCWWLATVRAPNTCATFGLLRLFQILNCLGKLSAYDFLRGLEMCTNHDGLEKPPDRRKPFMHIVRQWREVKRMKRGKRGHDVGGVRATKQGELALMCRACPQPGWNLPRDWEMIDPFYRFIYFLFLAQDANFRLSNRAVSSEVADPILGDGFGFFCKREGDDGYKAHIAKHVNEQEISNCSGFQAMFMANTRRVKGLRTTGIGGVTCSRHNMWCGNGIGDLQVGERYCNMDFLLLSALMTFGLLCVVVSYDIACQYAINFWQRMSEMPEPMRLKLAPGNIWWKVPNFHLPPHKRPCHSPYSFHWMWGAGMTHGEGVEQNWSFSNGAAASTRLMGPGSHQATLEDIFGFHNYDRVLAMHRVLPRRLAVSIKEGTKHKVSFEAFTAGLEALRPEEVKEWKLWVARWESKQHTDSSESPFELAEEGAYPNGLAVTTLRDIQVLIATEEYICTDDGVEVEREHTPGSFIAMGLELEELQRRLEVDIRALKDPSPAQKLGFMKRRTTMLKRIHKFRAIQRVYMPAIRAMLSDAQKQVFDGNGEQLPEATRLFMPSEIGEAMLRGRVCAIGLPELEARMREGEAADALDGVRQGLRTRTMTNRYKLRNYTGQGMMTKGQGILRQINIKIHAAKLRYRYARAALLVLRGHGAWEEGLWILNEDDVRALNERVLTAEEKAQNEHWAELGGAIIEGGVDRAAALASREGSHTLSWIWYTAGVRANDEDDPRLHDALRLEWCKAYARMKRYSEDVRLLREEMRRTVAFGRTEAEKWDVLARDELANSSPELTEGRRAYAAEHTETERETCAWLEKNWAGILQKADLFLEGNAALDAEAVVMVELSLGDELDPEDEEARLEGEDDDDE
ncbi:hypothetical protein B0H11DRAFT_2165768 [Mycena galericulata]|nr:hypothetical protein B0H11DRAFT_2165768 [Mycena galericulata]